MRFNIATIALMGVLLLYPVLLPAAPLKPVRSRIGESVQASNGTLTLTTIGKKQSFNARDKDTYDPDINSPKSVNFHPDGTKYYVNSLEGCRTVVYDMKTNQKIKVIHHRFDSGQGLLWSLPSGYYPFTHYEDGAARAFEGKPVESTFSHGGRYMWVPYYRRSFDNNAQDPSAIAIIDTRTDEIVRMMETGPLPKMVACSNNGNLLAVTHWGDNTVGLIDISSDNPKDWHHLAPVVVGHQLKLNFPLTGHVNRDSNSGYLLRGTVFTPDDRYLIVGCMGGGGGIAVIDVQAHEYLGMIGGISNARHLIICNGYLYLSRNQAGEVKRVAMRNLLNGIAQRTEKKINVTGWETCQVGAGARTIEASPSGKYIFAACNTASQLYVVDTETMTAIAHITVDSYPVGLHISNDGKFLVTTSQGRSNAGGGNAVDLFRVDYARPEPVKQLPADSTVAAAPHGATPGAAPGTGQPIRPWMLYTGGGLIAVAAMAALSLKKKKKP